MGGGQGSLLCLNALSAYVADNLILYKTVIIVWRKSLFKFSCSFNEAEIGSSMHSILELQALNIILISHKRGCGRNCSFWKNMSFSLTEQNWTNLFFLYRRETKIFLLPIAYQPGVMQCMERISRGNNLFCIYPH